LVNNLRYCLSYYLLDWVSTAYYSNVNIILFSENPQQTITSKVTITESASPYQVKCHPKDNSVYQCRKVSQEEFQGVQKKLVGFTKAQRAAFSLGFLEHAGEENLKYVFPETEKRVCGKFFAEAIGVSLRTIQKKLKRQKEEQEKEEEIAVSVFNH
jgi:hypothetical protein